MALEDYRSTQVKFLRGEIAAGWRFVLTAETLLILRGRDRCLHFAQMCHDEVVRLLGLMQLTPDEQRDFDHSLAELQGAIDKLRESATA